MIMDMTPDQKKQMIIDKCICKSCPSWKECGGIIEPGGFCYDGIGKSNCITEEKGCICPTCSITEIMKLKNDYYCTKGSAKSQMMG